MSNLPEDKFVTFRRDEHEQREAWYEAEIERQKAHNKLLTETLAAERKGRKHHQEINIATSAKIREALARAQEVSRDYGSSVYDDLCVILDPTGLIRAGVGV